LSTLTKVLIVLLTVASIFLCGVVVTYVASAENFREKWQSQQNSARAAMQQRDQAKEELNSAMEAHAAEKTKLNGNIAALQAQITNLKTQLTDAMTARDEARRRKENYESLLAANARTGELHAQLQKEAQDAQVKLEAEKTRLEDELNGVTSALNEKLAIVMQLEAKVKSLAEEKTALQNKLDKFLTQYGKITAKADTVTIMREAARVAPPAKDIDVKGLLTDVNLKDNVVEISVGAADGVKEGMRFHATRGNKFICDVVVLDVEPEKALGWLELLQDTPENKPKAGDVVSTNL